MISAVSSGLWDTLHCPYCGEGVPEDEDHLFWECATWEVVRGPLALLLISLAGEIPWLPADPTEWPPCLRLCCLPPTHLFGGATAEVTSRFVAALLNMFCRVLRMRLGRERRQDCLFNKPGVTQKTYPFGELCGPKPRPEAGPAFPRPSADGKWRSGMPS